MTRFLRRYHPIVWWIVALHATFGLCFVLLTPSYRGPDEAEHVDMARQYRGGPVLPDPTQHVPLTPGLTETTRLMGPGLRPRPPQIALAAVPRHERPSFDELDTIGGDTFRNQMTQHPPLYYTAQSTVISTITAIRGGPMSWDTEVLVYRLVSWLATLALPLLAAEGALALGLGRGATAVAAAVTLCVPMATWVGILVNNDSFVMTGAAAAVVGALGFANHGGWRYAALTAVGCVVAPWAKSTGAPIVAWAGLVVAVSVLLVAARRQVGPLLLMAAGAIVGGSWHMWNLIRYADPQPNGFGPGDPETGADTSILAFVPEFATRVNPSFWGEPGRRTGVSLPDWAFTTLALTGIAVLVVGVVLARPRLPTMALTGLVGATILLLFRATYRGHVGSGRFPALQGRYLFPLLIPIALLIAAGVISMLRRWTSGSEPEVTGGSTGGVIATAGVGLHVLLGWSMLTGGYWDSGGRGARGHLSSVLAWSALPRPLTVAVFLGTGLLVLAAGVVAARAGRSVLFESERPGVPDNRTAETLT